MDINTLNLTALSDIPKEIAIIDPRTLEVTPFKVQVVGPQATKKNHHDRIIEGELLSRAAALLAEGKELADLTHEERDLLEARSAAAVVVGWSGLTKDGEPLPFSDEAAIDLFKRNPWIVRQIERVHLDAKNFQGAPVNDVTTAGA